MNLLVVLVDNPALFRDRLATVLTCAALDVVAQVATSVE